MRQRRPARVQSSLALSAMEEEDPGEVPLPTPELLSRALTKIPDGDPEVSARGLDDLYFFCVLRCVADGIAAAEARRMSASQGGAIQLVVAALKRHAQAHGVQSFGSKALGCLCFSSLGSAVEAERRRVAADSAGATQLLCDSLAAVVVHPSRDWALETAERQSSQLFALLSLLRGTTDSARIRRASNLWRVARAVETSFSAHCAADAMMHNLSFEVRMISYHVHELFEDHFMKWIRHLCEVIVTITSGTSTGQHTVYQVLRGNTLSTMKFLAMIGNHKIPEYMVIQQTSARHAVASLIGMPIDPLLLDLREPLEIEDEIVDEFYLSYEDVDIDENYLKMLDNAASLFRRTPEAEWSTETHRSWPTHSRARAVELQLVGALIARQYAPPSRQHELGHELWQSQIIPPLLGMGDGLGRVAAEEAEAWVEGEEEEDDDMEEEEEEEEEAAEI